MSRGYGRVQRAILETLSDQRGLSTADITRRVYGHRQAHCGTLPMAETAAVSRALAGLKRGGLVKVPTPARAPTAHGATAAGGSSPKR